MSSQSGSILTQFSGGYYHPSLVPYGMPLNGLGWSYPDTFQSSKRNDLRLFLSKKLEIFKNITITESESLFHSVPPSNRARIMFLPIIQQSAPIMSFYRTIQRKTNTQYLSSTQMLAGACFPSIRVAFVFLNPEDGFNSDLREDTCLGYICSIFGILRPDTQPTVTGACPSFGKVAINRKQTTKYTNILLKQWYKNTQDPIKALASRLTYSKAPPPQNIANKSQYSDTLVLTKLRHIKQGSLEKLPNSEKLYSGWNTEFSRDTHFVIKGMLGHSGDADYLKMILEPGDHTFVAINTKNSMARIKLQLLNPMTEVPKNKNKLNTTTIKNECANKISYYPQDSSNIVECFGLDKNSEPPLEEGGEKLVIRVKKRTFVYIKVKEFASTYNDAQKRHQDLGIYYIALIGDKKKILNEFRYPSCYLNWALNPDPIVNPERKITPLKVLKNNEPWEIPFYLQEKEDNIKGAFIVPKKLNVVINGKLISSDSSNAVKFITSSTEFAPNFFQYLPNIVKSDERFYLFSTNSKGFPVGTEFFVSGEGRMVSGGADQYLSFVENITPNLSSCQNPPDEDEPETETETPEPTQTPTQTVEICAHLGYSETPQGASCVDPCEPLFVNTPWTTVNGVSYPPKTCYKCIKQVGFYIEPC